MRLYEILEYLEQHVPFSMQEDYDNSGLLIGDPGSEVNSALLCVDVTAGILDEAISNYCDLVISHHPLIFSPLKKLTGKTLTERLVTRAIKNNIAIIALHTNLDNYSQGVNQVLCDKLHILKTRILRPLEGNLRKLITFCPADHSGRVREALFQAGAGHIGNYDSCSFNVNGKGTFRALEGANPFVGQRDELHYENEDRIEVLYPVFREAGVLKALFSSHPYEEVAFDIIPLENTLKDAGAGRIGELAEPADPAEFLAKVKKVLSLGCIRHTALPQKKIQHVAVCGGSGSFLIKDAIASKADIFLTGDIRYHDFFLPDSSMILADIGHYESEQFTKELILTLLKKKFPTFALRISEISTNPINYL